MIVHFNVLFFIIPYSPAKCNEKEIISMTVFLCEGHTTPEPKQKEEMTMNCNANKCIECTVHQCANHCEGENYCALDKILVGTHEANPTVDQCTDCKSFRKK